MRTGHVLLAMSLALALGAAQPAQAQTKAGSRYSGIWVSTPYPSFSIPSTQTVTLDLTVHNTGLPPQDISLNVSQKAKGWGDAFLGGGKRVRSVFVAPDGNTDVKLRLDPPAGVEKGQYRFVVTAKGSASRFSLPIELSVGDALPPKLTLSPELPALKGSADSDFEFKVKVRNEGGGNATVGLDAAAPPSFLVKFEEEYGSQEIASFPLAAGAEKTIKVKVTPPYGTNDGKYNVRMRAITGHTEADTKLTLDVTGQPKLALSGPNGRLSADAYVGEQAPVNVVLSNNGSATARNVKLSATEPDGWKVTFNPKTVEALAPNKSATVKALVTPSSRAIAGDYMVTVRAAGDGTSKSTDYRITVRTSTMWGIVGVLIIAAALIVLVLAVVRYGRR